ncbi:MAG: oxygen-independent coproporphyrinogen III oxidase [Rhodospirillales bacterium]|jgi:oxygen-independent coproporphyrinogen-3 oxidase|nr:oxygen-independent coproporphyrinogen III oxidase [Rhodospirillales bacterium]
MNVETLLAKYDRRVPRYTSYPTAPQFSAAVDAARYRQWLAGLADAAPLSVYLHVPFCAELCWFCGCHTTVTRRAEPLASYARTLLDEIDLLADAIGRPLPVRHVHWGGGTPTALSSAWMTAVATRLRTRFALGVDAEIAVEVDPRTLTEEAADTLAAIGVTRASLGIQDFDPAVQAAVNRHQSYEVTAAAAQRLRARGIGAINLDLIYGLPYQTVAGVAATVARALDLGPDRVAVFGYAHVPWLKRHQKLLPEAALPGPAERFAQREAAERVILAAGFERIGLDHYARPRDGLATAARAGRVRRNFQGYTTDAAPVLLGLGASSIGALPDGYVQNETPIPAWRDTVRAGRLPIARGVALTAEDRLRRDVIEQVMCYGEADLPEIAARHGVGADALLAAGPVLAGQAEDGLVRWDGSRVQVTARGWPFVRAVAAAFDAYLRPEATRHAAAI